VVWPRMGGQGVFINGTVGVGKTSAAYALAALPSNVPVAMIDLDEISRLRPAPAGDPFNRAIMLTNLRSLAQNYREAGVKRFVMAGVIESESETKEYQDALGTCVLFVVRLTADAHTVQRRLKARHIDDPPGLSWHLERAGELSGIQHDGKMVELQIETDMLNPREVACCIQEAVDW